MSRLLAIAVLLAACTDSVVEMELVLPRGADAFDNSCISAVEVRVNGSTFPQSPGDQRRSCLEITAGASYESVREAVRGKFKLAMPDTELAGVEVYGWSGPAPCKDDMNVFVSPDLLFSGRGDYIGQDRMEIPLVPNLGCARTPLKIRLVDMFKLVRGATCTEATAVADRAGWGGVGTLAPKLTGKGAEFFGGLAWDWVVGGIAQFNAPSQVGPKACLASDGSVENLGGSTGCAIGGPTLCAGAGEIEHPIVDGAIIGTEANWDPTILVSFPGNVIGSVWSAARVPVAGATVEVNPAHGKIVYLDPPPAGSGALVVRNDGKTGPSGLFMLYTDRLASVTVKANGSSRTVVLGAMDELVAAAMIVMP